MAVPDPRFRFWRLHCPAGSYGDTYNSSRYGFSLARRPFYRMGIPVRFGVHGASQQR